MKRVPFLCAAILTALLVPSARADLFHVTFDGGALGYSGAGTFSGTGAGGTYILDSVMSGSVTDPVFGTSQITSLSSYAGADNLLSFPDMPFFDGNGLAFTLANGTNINLFFDGFESAALESNPNGDIPESITASVTRAVTPEPGSLLLFGTATTLGAGCMVRRRRLSM